jgi:hypothetical protein
MSSLHKQAKIRLRPWRPRSSVLDLSLSLPLDFLTGHSADQAQDGFMQASPQTILGVDHVTAWAVKVFEECLGLDWGGCRLGMDI